LHAETFIGPAGITSSTLRTIPDVPVGTFELTRPQDKLSALGANASLCKVKVPAAGPYATPDSCRSSRTGRRPRRHAVA
jgi:hypothetical protein